MTQAATDYTIDELMSACISRQIRDGELIAQGIATPLVAAGYILAKLTHAPNIVLISAIGQAYCFDWAPLAINKIESLWIGKGVATVGFVAAACDLLPQLKPLEFFRPGQVDAYGNFNNVHVGGTHQRPRLRLPGAGGIADVTVFEEKVCLYVPRHGRHTFVDRVDFLSGLGHNPARRRGSGPRYLISDLAQFDFGGAGNRMRLRSLHEGVSLDRLNAKTGFHFEVPPDVTTTPAPTKAETALLREQIDPLGVRRLETLRGADRRRLLQEILEREGV